MKDSGLQWVGKIPAEWEVAPLYSTARQVKKLNVGNRERNLLSLSYGRIKRKDIDMVTGLVPASYAGYNIIESGDIVLRLTDLQNDKKSIRVGLSKERGIVTSAYVTIRPDGKVSSDYLAYSILAFDIAKGFYGIGSGVRQGLTYDEVKKLKFQFPPLPEQEAIAAFLDSVTGMIDELRGKLKREIDRLEDYKKSAITKAVCHGLDPKAKMKDSGIPWVGKVPESWKVNRGKYFLRLLARPTREDDGVITCFRDGEVTLRSNRREEGFTISLKECGYQGIEPGDLVVHGMDGFAGSIGISNSRGKASPVLNVLDTDEDKKYLMYYLRSMAYRDVFTALSTGIRVRSCDLRWKKLADLVYILPPLPEQREIAEHIDTMVGRVNAIVEKRKRQLDALDKLKRTVVYDYVTGKREVPLPKGGRSR